MIMGDERGVMRVTPCERHRRELAEVEGRLLQTTTPEACRAVALEMRAATRQVSSCGDCRREPLAGQQSSSRS
jgi:hypothetical protein